MHLTADVELRSVEIIAIPTVIRFPVVECGTEYAFEVWPVDRLQATPLPDRPSSVIDVTQRFALVKVLA